MQKQLIYAIGLLVLTSAGCKNKDPEEPAGNSFDKEAMLENIGQSVAIVSYAELNASLDALDEAVSAFEVERTAANLEILRAQFLQTYSLWEACSVFEFGPAAEHRLRLTLNTFPADTAQINTNVESGSYDLSAAQNSDAKCLPALDHLLFSRGDVAASLAWLKDEQYSEYRVDYIAANVALARQEVKEVLNAWQPAAGNYLDDFKSNTGSSVSSSLGFLVNQICYEYELLKNARIGIPLGKKTLGVPQPEKVEARASQYSLELAIANLDGIEAAWAGGQGSGIDDYLDALGAKHGSQNLSAAIRAGFADVRTKLQAVEPTLAQAVADKSPEVEAAYAAIEQLVVLLKVDMPSQLGVQITYQDNDGD